MRQIISIFAIMSLYSLNSAADGTAMNTECPAGDMECFEKEANAYCESNPDDCDDMPCALGDDACMEETMPDCAEEDDECWMAWYCEEYPGDELCGMNLPDCADDDDECWDAWYCGEFPEDAYCTSPPDCAEDDYECWDAWYCGEYPEECATATKSTKKATAKRAMRKAISKAKRSKKTASKLATKKIQIIKRAFAIYALKKTTKKVAKRATRKPKTMKKALKKTRKTAKKAVKKTLRGSRK
mmetsp:Transcript_57091/g.48195  ORF Transcript_57091/g.48195 Transcript_57091/m.48195 type:complete len:242 (-) Transcript_57091:98-823(-)